VAKAGSPSKVAETAGGRSAETRQQLVAAAVETLKEKGFGGASARAIAERAGSTQGLIFYHFGSVTSLLLAALDSVSAERLAHYGAAIDGVDAPAPMVRVARTIFSEDLDAGYVTVLAEMIAGASSTPGLGPEVAARIGPWTSFAQGAIEQMLGESPLASALPADDVAYGIVALYLGLEMLSHLNGDREPAERLFNHAEQLAGLLANLGAGHPDTKASIPNEEAP
jgi:AcrR family transcriptional regulator